MQTDREQEKEGGGKGGEGPEAIVATPLKRSVCDEKIRLPGEMKSHVTDVFMSLFPQPGLEWTTNYKKTSAHHLGRAHLVRCLQSAVKMLSFNSLLNLMLCHSLASPT